MIYIARLSGGTASAVATERAIVRYGRGRVIIRFENVSFEDEDNYRFIGDLMARWGGQLYGSHSGKTPLDVFEDRQIIPNSGIAPCSYELKIKPFEQWLWRTPKPVTILGGLDWREPQRIARILHYHKHAGKWRCPQGFSRRIPGVYEDFPLLWKPIETRNYSEVVRSWGVEPPRSYVQGFPHANCGGRCIRQGISEWKRLYLVNYPRFAQMRDWEQAQRAKGGARANAAICRTRLGGVSLPITLAELEVIWRVEKSDQYAMFVENTDDRSACFCTEETYETEIAR